MNIENQLQKMEALPTTLLSTDEMTVAATRILPVLEPLIAEDAQLLRVHAAAAKNAEAVTLARTRAKGSASTKDIRDADDRRDNAFQVLRDFSSTWAANLAAAPEQREAGARLTDLFKKHGTRLHSLGDDKQTAKMKALIVDLELAEAVADLEILGLTALAETMKTAQNQFEALVTVDENPDLPLISDEIPPLRRRLTLLLSVLAELETLAPTDAEKEAIDQVDAIIVDIMTPVRSRQTRAGGVTDSQVPTEASDLSA